MTRILGFACQWCAYKAIDLAGQLKLTYPDSIRIVRVPCSGRVDAELILSAFKEGFDGVFVAGCPENECHYRCGNVYAERRVRILKSMLHSMNIEPTRLEFVGISSSDAPGFVRFARMFHERIEKLGKRW
ncbi:MAG: hydrogenase iron-sulfur subunit [Archaeoglobi archaeon]|nr:hydrogenase iron-sulfur subunit [Archaeoglobi archaeon]